MVKPSLKMEKKIVLLFGVIFEITGLFSLLMFFILILPEYLNNQNDLIRTILDLGQAIAWTFIGVVLVRYVLKGKIKKINKTTQIDNKSVAWTMGKEFKIILLSLIVAVICFIAVIILVGVITGQNFFELIN
jgi:uncharacterized membrane protein YbhN (UPF0104 family)